MAKVKSYMNPNIPKPKPRGDTDDGLVIKPMERRITPTTDSRKKRITARGISPRGRVVSAAKKQPIKPRGAR
jgi:hypothetical protein